MKYHGKLPYIIVDRNTGVVLPGWYYIPENGVSFWNYGTNALMRNTRLPRLISGWLGL